MPVEQSALDPRSERIRELIDGGYDRDQAVAIAYEEARRAAKTAGAAAPSRAEFVKLGRQHARRGRGKDYLETALSAAREKLAPADFAVIHTAARARAGGMATARLRSPVEKALLLGVDVLTQAELDAAVQRAETIAAGDGRLGIQSGAEVLAEALWAERARRLSAAAIAKSQPGAGDVHVPTTAQRRTRKDKLPGGAGDKTKPGDVDPQQLAMGTRHELEHTRDRDIAQEIALDHLTEDAAYYTKLDEMERGGKTTKADRSSDPGVMIALRLPAATAAQVAIEGGEPAGGLHVTLAYLGRMSKVGPDGLLSAAEAINAVASTPVLRGVLSGVGRFSATESSDGKDVIIRLVDVPGVADMRARLVRALEARGLSVSRAHDFTPHITLAYVDPSAATPFRRGVGLSDVYFDAVVLAVNDSDTVFPLAQPDPLHAAREAARDAQSTVPLENTAVAPSAPAVVIQTADQGMAIEFRTSDGVDTLIAKSSEAFDLEPGDVVEVSADMVGDLVVERPSSAVAPAARDVVMKAAEAAQDARRYGTKVPFVGPADAPIVFVSGAPNELELARGEPLVGPDGVAFVERYLAPLGLAKSDVAIGFACPVLPRCPSHEIGQDQTGPWTAYVTEQLARWPHAAVVAVGKAAFAALGDRALSWLPHPYAARANEARYAQQIDRKMRRIRKAVDDGFAVVEDKGRSRAGQLEILAGRIGETLTEGPGRALARVVKAAGEKQIVYGVVLDPYEVDMQEEWVPPAVIESAAHDYLRQSRVIGREHVRKAVADLVESWCVHYPTPRDYQAAMSMQPHRAYEMPFGVDTVHSGAWIAGVRLGDAEWAAYKRGEITGFSIGGFSAKTWMDKASMPKVEFVPLVEGVHA